MSWLDKILPPTIQNNNKAVIPDGLWIKCSGCHKAIYHAELIDNLYVCSCSFHQRISARTRILQLCDNYEEIATEIKPKNLINFTDSVSYDDRLVSATKKTKETDALIVGSCKINNYKAVLSVFEFGFVGGSLGAVVGEKFIHGIKTAVELNCPFICVTASGGARMQEGIFSLMQMAKTVAGLKLLKNNKLPFISILTDPTFGGVSASFAFLADIIIAEPKALIGFAGPRVIEQTMREKLPDGFQTSEFLLEKGAIDMIIHRSLLKAKLTDIISFFN